MKVQKGLILGSILSLCLISHTALAEDCSTEYCYSGVLPNAIQLGLIANDGMNIALVHFDENYSYGLSLAGKTGKSNNQTTHLFTPAIFGGLRWHINPSTYFAFGLDLASKYGKENGQSVKHAVGVGPYLQLDYHMMDYVILSAWINPYFYSYEKIGSTINKTNYYFNTGGVGVSYFFN